MTNEELPRFDIIDGEVILKPDGMCVHSALVDELEMKFARSLKLLKVWHDAFGAECYNDALIAHDAATERLLRESMATQTFPHNGTPQAHQEKSTS